MAWDFLRRMLKFMGGKIMGKLAPRLIFFQYTNLVNNELDQKKRRYRMQQIRSQSQWLIQELRMKQLRQPLGLSEILVEQKDDANILTAYDTSNYFQTETVVSEYDDYQQTAFEFIELDASYVQDI